MRKIRAYVLPFGVGLYCLTLGVPRIHFGVRSFVAFETTAAFADPGRPIHLGSETAGVAGGGSLFVPDFSGGRIIEIDELGQKTVFVSGLGKPGTLKFGPAGNLFVVDHGVPKRLLSIARDKTVSVFTTSFFDSSVTPNASINDLTVDGSGRVFVLLHVDDPVVICPAAPLEPTHGEVWELHKDAPATLVATTLQELPVCLGGDARGFSEGPGGHLYLAMQNNGRVVRMTKSGLVSTFFRPAQNMQMIDVHFRLTGEFFILLANQGGILRVADGILSPFVGPGVLPNGSLQFTIDRRGVLFVAGGGFGGGQPDGSIQKVDLDGTVSGFATFPAQEGFGPIGEVDTGEFQFFPSDVGAPALSLLAGLMLGAILLGAGVPY
jgi:hypothetical protein